LNETYEEGEEPYKFSIDEDGPGGIFEPYPDAKDYNWVTCTGSGESYKYNECGLAEWPKIDLQEDEISETGISGTRHIVSDMGVHTMTLDFQYTFPDKQ
jgi:hypothetical protein